MLVVVGLGNPGTEYEATRHNVGFRVVDTLCRRWERQFRPGKGQFFFAHGILAGQEVALVKPVTYMNNSGEAVREALEKFGVEAGSLLIVLDDVALPLGTLRIRPAGSDGGHNGLYSIIADVGTEEIPRLRCGIGPNDTVPGRDMADFVLSPFRKDERAAVDGMIVRAADAVTEFAAGGISSAMNRFNTSV